MQIYTALTSSPSRPVNWDSPSLTGLEDHVKTLTDLRMADHARERMEQRGISFRDIETITLRGTAYKLEPGMRKGEWKVNLTYRLRGREAAVALMFKRTLPYAVVLTAMWRDVC